MKYSSTRITANQRIQKWQAILDTAVVQPRDLASEISSISNHCLRTRLEQKENPIRNNGLSEEGNLASHEREYKQGQ